MFNLFKDKLSPMEVLIMRCVVCVLLIALTVSLVSTAQVGYIRWMDPKWVEGANLNQADVVVIAIDNSGSIRLAGRLRHEQNMAIDVLQNLLTFNGNNPRIYVVAFNSDIELPPVIDAHLNTLARRNANGNIVRDNQGIVLLSQDGITDIRGIRDTSNLTWINGVIDHACSITDPLDPTGVFLGPGTGTLVLFTDGRPTTPTRDGPRDIAAADRATRDVAAPHFAANCSTLAVIGVDVTLEDEQFLREIASPNAYIYMSTARIAVAATNIDVGTDIYVMNSDGTELTNLTSTPDRAEVYPVWSPDGTRLMFETRALESYDAYRRPYEIHSVNSDGTDAENLTNTPHTHETYPSWSPDSTRIAFASCAIGRCDVWFGPYDIYVMNSDGTEPTNLLDEPVAHASPVWSPDGTKIMFLVGADLCIMGADGSNRSILASGIGELRPPSLSPDGERIVFSADTNMDGRFEIWMVDVGGSDPGKLTRLTDIGDSRYPAWSPDGARIAFACLNDADPWEIYVMNPDGSAQTQLTDHPDQLGLYLDYAHPPLPVWSLDGRMIAYCGVGAFTDSQYPWRGIVVMSADGSHQSVILEGSELENSDWIGFSHPAWEPRPAYDE